MTEQKLDSAINAWIDWGDVGPGGPVECMQATSHDQAVVRRSGRRELREQRLDELLTSCRERSIESIVGPFGLTAAMFDDKRGGNVTTQHNAEQGIFAKQSEELERSDYDYAVAKRAKMKQAHQDGAMDSTTFTDTYTQKAETTKRTASNGKLAMNVELDHVIPVKEIHAQGGWMRDKKGRADLSSTPDNLQYTTHENNRKKGAQSATEFLSAENGFDESITRPIIEKAQAAVDDKLPSTGERVVYHGKELLGTGAKEAGKNALRQALGVLMFEFVNGSYGELVQLVREPAGDASFIDQIVAALRRVITRVQGKMLHAFDAFVSGGTQGFISNLLTFVINSLVTTSAKLVTIIRESIKGLWAAIKLIVAPPPDVAPMDRAREATKLIAAVITASLGMLFEESVKGVILSMPFLAPVAEPFSAVVTGILTGLVTALAVYSIDRMFDALDDKGTQALEARIGALEADADLASKLSNFIAQQYRNSRIYDEIVRSNFEVTSNMADSTRLLSRTVTHAQDAVSARAAALRQLSDNAQAMREMDDELAHLLDNYQLEGNT